MSSARVVVRSSKPRANRRRFFLVDSAPEWVAHLSKGPAYECRRPEEWDRVFTAAKGEGTWITSHGDKTEELLRAASVFLASHHGRHATLGDLLLLAVPRTESLPALQTFFRTVAGRLAPGFTLLPPEELAEVLAASDEEARDLFIAGVVDPLTETVTLTRGNLKTLVVPMSLFRPSGRAAPNFADFAVIDYGHSLQFGEYEAAADALLYEVDPEYRKRQKAKHRQEDKSFGACLRRLRLQRHLARTDFPGLSAKTLARIERSETGKPHGKTLGILAKTLGVAPDDIETY